VRILYVTESFPYPLTSGVLRHYHFISELAVRHRITLLSLVPAGWSRENGEPLADRTEHVETFPASFGGSRLNKAAARMAGFVGGEPAARGLAARAWKLHEQEPFTGVIVSGKRTFPVARRMATGMAAGTAAAPIVADLCDATSARLAGAIRFAPARRLPALLTEYAATRLAERRLIGVADELVFVSERDRRLLMGQDRGGRETVVPNGVDTAYWRRTSPSLGRDEVVFTGAMDYPPNVDAALVLIREVMPAVRGRRPAACLSIVGRDPVAALRREASSVVRVTGTVPDMRPYLEAAAVFAAPLRFGVGMQNKIVEAMAMEVPVVTTPLVAEGLRSTAASAPIAVARSVEEAAACIVDALDRAAAGAPPDTRARTYVEHTFRWQVNSAALEATLERAAERRHASNALSVAR
jgi:glycosyltransferase involved in cell wall biosynthesis